MAFAHNAPAKNKATPNNNDIAEPTVYFFVFGSPVFSAIALFVEIRICAAAKITANTNKGILAMSTLDTIKTNDGIIESNKAFTIPFLFHSTIQDMQYPKSKAALTVM